MRRPTQGCLFEVESDRPRWNELLTSSQDTLHQLMQQLLLEAAQRAEMAKNESEVSDDERQDHV